MSGEKEGRKGGRDEPLVEILLEELKAGIGFQTGDDESFNVSLSLTAGRMRRD